MTESRSVAKLNEIMYLSADDDGDINLQCLKCDRDRHGLPVAFYTFRQPKTIFAGTDVIAVQAITDLVTVGVSHIEAHHA